MATLKNVVNKTGYSYVYVKMVNCGMKNNIEILKEIYKEKEKEIKELKKRIKNNEKENHKKHKSHNYYLS